MSSIRQYSSGKCRKMLLVLFCALSVTGALHAQEGTVKSPDGQTTVGQALKQIEAQTGFIFAVNHNNFNVKRTVRLSGGEMPVKTVLSQLLSGSGHTWLVNDKHIIIVPDKDKDLDPASIPQDKIILLSEVLAEIPTTNSSTVSQTKYEMQTVRKVETVETQRNVIAFGNQTGESFLATREYNALSRTNDSRPPRYGIKINLLHGIGALTPNLGVEFGLGQRTTLDVYAAYNPWKLDDERSGDKKLVHTIIQPEFRYWLCERFNGHFFGVHGIYTNYNINRHNVLSFFDKEYRNEGYGWGAGISYGYYWMLNKKWGLEFTAGAGAVYMKYDRYDCEFCSDKMDSKEKTYFGLTKAGISLVFNIK